MLMHMRCAEYQPADEISTTATGGLGKRDWQAQEMSIPAASCARLLQQGCDMSLLFVIPSLHRKPHEPAKAISAHEAAAAHAAVLPWKLKKEICYAHQPQEPAKAISACDVAAAHAAVLPWVLQEEIHYAHQQHRSQLDGKVSITSPQLPSC